jgi:hypothetical protein
VIIRPERLSVEGQEHDFVQVSMQNINKNINTAIFDPRLPELERQSDLCRNTLMHP